MKVFAVLLYLMNASGGDPLLVHGFETMAECNASREASQGTDRARLVCVPIYVGER